jgi:aminopeptidase N
MPVLDDQELSRRKVLGGGASLALGAGLAGLNAGRGRAATATSSSDGSGQASNERARPMQINRLPPGVTPEHYDLVIRPDPRFFDSAKLLPWFEGSVSIRIRVDQPTSEVMLNAADLHLHAAILDGDASAAIILNQREQTATLVFERPIAIGTHTLSIDYSGKIYEASQGLFVSEYATPEGRRRLLLTQFEPGDARRLMPCWDEPARKATFTVACAAPKGKLAVSNMPIQATSELDDERVYVRFRQTPKMSTYLLFLGIGDLERVSKLSGDTIVSIVAKTGSAKDGMFALDSAVNLLEYYNDYFGIPFPLPKLDLVAAPSAGGFSAMENWGAILYFEDQLLLNPEWSTESNRQRVFIVVAHEMAHQWFGDLVTMEWWDNLWLNEGFASWMESKATDLKGFHPDWMYWLESEFDLQRAMRQDALHTTHPVVQEVLSIEDAAAAFDDITYRKGRAVIRMIENYVGENAFRDGIRAYMKRYAHKNTVTDNLWDELETASGKKIKELAGDFTNEPGVPLIVVESAAADGYKVRQKRFAVDDSANDRMEWTIPVSALSAGQEQPLVMMKKGDSEATAIPGSPPIKLNVGQTVYYRVNYGGAFAELADSFDKLGPADQLGLLNDTWALGEAGAAPIANYLDLTLKLTRNTDHHVCRQIIETLLAINSLYDPGPRRDRLRAYARKLLKPVLDSIGWDQNPRAPEPSNATVLRESLITALVQLGQPEVKTEADKRFKAYAGPPVNSAALPAIIRRPVLQAVSFAADDALYDAVYELAKSAQDSFAKDQMFVALAWANDESLAQRSLNIALSDDPPKTTGPKMIQSVADSHPDLAWDFTLEPEHLKALTARLDTEQQIRFIPGLTAKSRSAKVLEELRHISRKVPGISSESKSVKRSVAALEFRLRVVGQILPGIDDWLTSHG